MQIRFETEQAVGYFILVPENARDFKIFDDAEKPYLSCFVGTETPREYLPENGFTHLGTLSKMTEEQAATSKICGEFNYNWLYYKDYLKGGYTLETAMASIKSLADSAEVYNVNPLGEKPKNHKLVPIINSSIPKFQYGEHIFSYSKLQYSRGFGFWEYTDSTNEFLFQCREDFMTAKKQFREWLEKSHYSSQHKWQAAEARTGRWEIIFKLK